MLLTSTTTHTPATDLGHLLHKQPGSVQSLPVAGGQAHIFYSRAEPDRADQRAERSRSRSIWDWSVHQRSTLRRLRPLGGRHAAGVRHGAGGS